MLKSVFWRLTSSFVVAISFLLLAESPSFAGSFNYPVGGGCEVTVDHTVNRDDDIVGGRPIWTTTVTTNSSCNNVPFQLSLSNDNPGNLTEANRDGWTDRGGGFYEVTGITLGPNDRRVWTWQGEIGNVNCSSAPGLNRVSTTVSNSGGSTSIPVLVYGAIGFIVTNQSANTISVQVRVVKSGGGIVGPSSTFTVSPTQSNGPTFTEVACYEGPFTAQYNVDGQGWRSDIDYVRQENGATSGNGFGILNGCRAWVYITYTAPPTPTVVTPTPPGVTVTPAPNQCFFGGVNYNPGDKRYECGYGPDDCASDACVGVPYVCNDDGTWSNANPAGECTTECTDCRGGPTPGPGPYCGDGICDPGEDCANCSTDCGSCPGGGGIADFDVKLRVWNLTRDGPAPPSSWQNLPNDWPSTVTARPGDVLQYAFWVQNWSDRQICWFNMYDNFFTASGAPYNKYQAIAANAYITCEDSAVCWVDRRYDPDFTAPGPAPNSPNMLAPWDSSGRGLNFTGIDVCGVAEMDYTEIFVSYFQVQVKDSASLGPICSFGEKSYVYYDGGVNVGSPPQPYNSCVNSGGDPDGADPSWTDVPCSWWFGSNDVVVNLCEYLPVDGYIRDSATGNPIPWVEIQVTDRTRSQAQRTSTNASGYFRIENFLRRDDIYDVYVVGNLASPQTAPFGYGPPALTTTSGWDWDYCLNPNPGTFPWADIPPGSQAYTCQRAGSGIDCSTPIATPTGRCSFAYNPLQTISGYVRDSVTSLGIGGVGIQVYDDTLSQSRTATTNALGFWQVTNFVRRGDSYAVRITGPTPVGYNPPAITTTTGWSWDYCASADTPYGSASYECQRAGSNDCATPIASPTGRCDFAYPPAPTCAVSLSPNPMSLIQGGASRTLYASVNVVNGTVSRVDFVSSNPGIATVNPASDNTSPYSTQVSGVAPGTTTVNANVYLNPGGILGCTTSVPPAIPATVTVSTQPSWFQTGGGDVHAEGELSSPIPSGITNPYLSLAVEGYPGVTSFGSTADFGLGSVSQTPPFGWLANSRFGGSGGPTDRYDYDFFLNRAGSLDTTTLNTAAPIQNTLANLNGFYQVQQNAGNPNGNLTIPQSSNWAVGGSASNVTVVIFVPGDLTIRGRITIPDDQNNFLAIIVQGDIIIEEDVYDPSSSNPAVEGVYLTNGQISTGTTGNPVSERQFAGQGVFVAWGGFDLERDLSPAENLDTPAESFEYDINLLMAALKLKELMPSNFVWEEVAP